MRVSPTRHGWARQKFAKVKSDAFVQPVELASCNEGRDALAQEHGPRAKDAPREYLSKVSLGRFLGLQRRRAAMPWWAKMQEDEAYVLGRDDDDLSADMLQDNREDQGAPSIELQFSFRSKKREMWQIVLRNTLLIILTLTLYRFWARTRVRNYLWSRIQIGDEPLEYTGRAGELLLGFLLILLIFVIPLALIDVSMQIFIRPTDPVFILYAIGLYLGVFFLVGVARYRAQRYRLSRTVWRGIRFGLKGSWISFGLRTLGLSYLTFFSLFLAYPAERLILMKQLMSNMTYGDRQFTFDGRVSKLYPSFIASWLLSIIVLFGTFAAASTGIIELIRSGIFPTTIDPEQLDAGLVTFELFALIVIATWLFYRVLRLILAFTTAWYRAKELRYFAQCTKLGGMQFALNAGGFAVMRLNVGNALIVLLTFGFGLPYAQMRTFRFIFSRLQGQGALNIDSIGQGNAPYPLIGEGLAEIFELGAV